MAIDLNQVKHYEDTKLGWGVINLFFKFQISNFIKLQFIDAFQGPGESVYA